MKVAYADPPYLGCCALYGHRHEGPYVNGCWNEVATHRRLVEWLVAHFPDGWALSASSPSLRILLEFCPADVRVSPWVKPFAVFKPGVNPAYAWEPVIWRGGRTARDRAEITVRDWLSENITLKRGLCGAKPDDFGTWVLDLLGVEESDEIVDVFPGTGCIERARRNRRDQMALFRPMQSSLLEVAGEGE